MDIHRDASLQVLPGQLWHLLGGQQDHLLKAVVHLLQGLGHDRLVVLGGHQPSLHVGGPLELNSKQRDLRGVAKDEVLEPLLVDLRVGALDDGPERLLHAVHQDLEPGLDVSLDHHRLLERDLLPARVHLRHGGGVRESHGRQRVEESRLEVGLHRGWVGPQTQNFQQGWVGHKVEPWEDSPL